MLLLAQPRGHPDTQPGAVGHTVSFALPQRKPFAAQLLPELEELVVGVLLPVFVLLALLTVRRPVAPLLALHGESM